MVEKTTNAPNATTIDLEHWKSLLRDENTLMATPGAHHKKLVIAAHALHNSDLIDRDDLSDLLEQADGALAYAMEALLDSPSDNR